MFGIGDVQLVIICLLELILTELKSKLGKLCLYGGKSLLVLLAEQCTAANKCVVCILQKLALLVVQPFLVFPYMLDAKEELLVVHDAGIVFGEHGRKFLCQCLHLVVGIGTDQVEEKTGCALQQFPCSWGNSILKGWYLRVVDDGSHCFVFLSHAFNDGRFIVVHLDARERYSLVQCLKMRFK